MVRLNIKKLEEIVNAGQAYAEQEIRDAKAAGTEMTEDDENAIRQKYSYLTQREIKGLINMGPQKLFKLGLTEDVQGWRSGYTKPTLASRKKERRAKNKLARKARKVNRHNSK